MDKTTSVIAAFSAGKLPTQQQVSQALEQALHSAVLSDDPSPDGGQLSEQGKVLQNDVREILEAYQQLVDSKDSDNIIQEGFWHFTEAEYSSTSTSAPLDIDKEQASKDAKAIARSLRTLFRVVWENLSQEGRSVFHDFASFMRLAVADAADYVAEGAGSTAEKLREIDAGVQEGERNELGLKKRKAEDEVEEADARAKFEKTMDSTKAAGSKAIGAGQAAVQTGQNIIDRTSTRLQDAFYKVCDRAQEDEEYHQSVRTIFDLAQKWVDKSLDVTGDVNQATSLDAFIDDPTPEQHLITGIRCFRTYLERLAGGKSLDQVFGRLRVCGVDIQNDPALRGWFDKLFAHLRKSLDERGYVRSEEAQQTRENIRKEWKDLLDADSDTGRKWKEDIGAFKEELDVFQKAIDRDEDLRRVRRAYEKLGDDLEESILVAGSAGFQNVMEKAPWFWQDVFNVYLPKTLGMLKDIPIPRTEYKDAEVEFVLEDLDISSFSLLPGHAYIRNITDIDITASSAGQADTAVGALTRVYVQALQVALREVSFYYKDKTASVGPAEFTGLLEFTLPPQGIDVDIVVRTIPNSPEGLKEREKRKGFTEIRRVEVKVSDDVDISVSQSNHPVLVTVFKPVMLSRFRDALRTVLEHQITAALEGADGLAWDVGRRAEVFEDTGLGRGTSLVAALWSEIGHLRRGEGGLFSGWKATGTGVIKEDKGAQFAMGAEPQVLSGEQRGPRGTFAEPLADRMDVDSKVQGAKEGVTGVAQQAKETVKEGVRKVKSFKDSIKEKTEHERNTPGWQSRAFDVI
ncbi:hypothetical protein CERSUDRAFT_136886 [Gelatoporia subvermispora B]|uniref:Uncharacterized protein n=1 Tax=Ceriporiopsis subvermispora (strain B) TaxID=914234 RepID=M2QHX3_CERS8|nr:hypothetical protein CERSUDRAFT_136886 [Gelatoporia subvermispora B]